MYKVSKKNIVYAMDAKNEPVLKVEDGAKVVFETCDCFEEQIQSIDTPFNALDWNRINPATGPIFIEGAEPGDTLVVKIESIKTEDKGVMVTGPDMGVIGGDLTENDIRMFTIQDGKAAFSDKVSIPLNPMIGVIGTAPVSRSIPCGEPGGHGGNMDCKMISAGATLYLPVEVPGALLAMGDLHAAMGDGEVSVCGVEVSGEVTVTVSVLKGRPWKLPMVKNDKSVFVVASEKSLDQAAITATKNMVDYLEKLGLSKYEAIDLMSVAGNLQICQVVDPLKTVRFEMPLYVIDKLGK